MKIPINKQPNVPDRCSKTKEPQSQVPHLAWWKCDADDGDDIRHDNSCANTTESSGNGERDDTLGAESIDECPENPPYAANEESDFMAVNCTDAASDEDECALCKPEFLIVK